tara:strand:+ start:114 stop:398 length:285 start_codon:yes stop_codon:yes gene_type:complete
MELICESFYFYNNGVYKTIENYSPEGWFTDLKRVEPSIKIFGTREQIDKALDDYIELTGLNLDEVYDYENQEMLKVYKEKYNKMNNNKALITTI